jgi:hypothetical protein
MRAQSFSAAIMKLMKRLALLMPLLGTLVAGQDLASVQSVYLFPMSQGLDQYLANRLTNGGVFRVVTDPKLADAIFTDKVGKAFEDQLSDLTSKPEPASEKDAEAGDASLADLVSKSPSSRPASSFGRSKGMVFLVNPKSHHVLWSVYELPKDSNSGHMDRTASDIVSRLKRDLKPK